MIQTYRTAIQGGKEWNPKNEVISEEESNVEGRTHYGTTYRHRVIPAPKLSGKAYKAISEAKRRHRPSLPLTRWNEGGFAGSDLCEFGVDSNTKFKLNREVSRDLDLQRFRDEYEIPEIPVIIDEIPDEQQWNAVHCWDLKILRKKYKNVELKCGEDDDGRTVRVKLKYFLKYMKDQDDDSPLYIFDSTFDDREATKPLLLDYSVPKYFPDDIFHLVGDKRRPPYRWFLIGPRRSGTTVHIDPLATSAWNTLLRGRKRWVIFPPHIPKKVVKAEKHIRKGEDDEASNYFSDILPRLKAEWKGKLECYEFIQYPGETVFVPGGWWHAVLNLDDTVAVTQNFCSRINFSKVWCKTRSGRKRMAVKLLEALKTTYPDLYDQAIALNKQDQYEMYRKRKAPEDDINPR